MRGAAVSLALAPARHLAWGRRFGLPECARCRLPSGALVARVQLLARAAPREGLAFATSHSLVARSSPAHGPPEWPGSWRRRRRDGARLSTLEARPRTPESKLALRVTWKRVMPLLLRQDSSLRVPRKKPMAKIPMTTRAENMASM